MAVARKTRVADMRPVGVARLHDARDAGRSRRFQHGELRRVRTERGVRLDHRLVEERERTLEDGLRFLLKALDEQAHRDLRRNLATCVPAHAVRKYQQQRVAAVGIGEPVLIDLALALAAFLEDGEAHAQFRSAT